MITLNGDQININIFLIHNNHSNKKIYQLELYNEYKVHDFIKSCKKINICRFVFFMVQQNYTSIKNRESL